MANKELKAKLVIDAQTSGAPGVVDLADGMEQLAHEARLAGEVLANRELLGVRAHADVQKEIAKTRTAYEQLKASGTLSQAELAQAADEPGAADATCESGDVHGASVPAGPFRRRFAHETPQIAQKGEQ